MAAGSNFAFKIVAKRLQIKTRLQLVIVYTRTHHRPIQRNHRWPLRLKPECMRYRQTDRQTTQLHKARP